MDEGGVEGALAYRGKHTVFKIETPNLTVRLHHGTNHQGGEVIIWFVDILMISSLARPCGRWRKPEITVMKEHRLKTNPTHLALEQTHRYYSKC